METTSIKCQRHSVDRISALPDDVLCSILSFLPTKNSIATSVLSKRWMFMWAHVPNLDFDSEHHKGLNLSTSFSDIIYRVMLMYKVQTMNKFRLSYKDPCGEYQLETCIATAIVRDVKNLYLELSNQVRLPLPIFTYKTLVDLRLYGCGNIPPASSAVYLPALKNLHLDKVRYESDQSLAHLLSGCPLLETLFVLRAAVDPLIFCYISSPTLISLTLYTCFANDGSYTQTYRVKIDTPALRYLKLWDTVSNNISCGPLTSLMEAEVCFNNNALVEGDVLYSRSVLELVGRLTNVKSLLITTSLLKVPDSAFLLPTTKFRNLTRLQFYTDWRFLSNFLIHAENLEYLAIEMVNRDLNHHSIPRVVPKCLLSHLTRVKIDQLRCTRKEFNMIAYFLRNAKVLTRMDIFSQLMGTDFKAKFEALNTISACRRGSEACQVVFH